MSLYLVHGPQHTVNTDTRGPCDAVASAGPMREPLSSVDIELDDLEELEPIEENEENDPVERTIRVDPDEQKRLVDAAFAEPG